MPDDRVYLSVVIPAYNEAKRIPKTLRRIHEYLAAYSFSYEIVVVLDGPTDSTREILKKLEGEIARLRILERSVNRGKGYTVKEGMLKAVGRIRLFTDADNSTDIAHFQKMRPWFDAGYGVVIASRDARDVAGARQAVPQPRYKRMIGRAGNLIVRALAVRGIYDTQCGFKAFRGDVAEKIFSQATIEGWGFDIEALALARGLKLKIGIIPALWINDERSHVRMFDYLRVLGDTVKVRANLLKNKYNF